MKINPGAHIQIVQNGITLRHPSLPPGPPPMIFPPVNPDSLQPQPPSVQPQQSNIPSFVNAYRPTVHYFGNGVPQYAEAPTGEPDNGEGFSIIDGQYHNLYKRDKNLSKRQSSSADGAVPSGIVNFEPQKDVVKRETDSTGIKVSL